MSDTSTIENQVLDVAGDEAKRTRYTGPVNLVFAGTEEVDTTTTGIGRGRPSVDLSEYEQALKANYAKNVKLPAEKKIAIVLRVNPEAVSTVKSRFASASATVNVGLTWSMYVKPGTDEYVTDDQGMTTLKVVAGKRSTGRGRKPGHSTDNGK